MGTNLIVLSENGCLNRTMSEFDVKMNRTEQKWSKKELIVRVLWSFISPVFRFSPRIFWGWRRLLLRVFGAKIGRHVNIYPTVKVHIPWNVSIGDFAAVGDNVILYALGPIEIAERVTISQGAHLCAGTHDLSKVHRPLIKSKIQIQQESWICADAFIGPNVKLGPRTIIGARSVVMRDVKEGLTVAGNPAQVIKTEQKTL